MALQARLAFSLNLALQFRRKRLVDLDVRVDTRSLDRLARWRVIERRRQAQRACFSQRNDGLDGALSEGPGTDNGRSLQVLQCARDNFRRGGRAAVDEIIAYAVT